MLGLAIVAAMVCASMSAPPSSWHEAVQWARLRRAQLARELASGPDLGGAAVVAALREGAMVAAADSERLARLRTERGAWPLTAADRALLAALAPACVALRGAARGGAASSREAPTEHGELGLLPLLDAQLVLARDPDATRKEAVDHALDALVLATRLAGAGLPLRQFLGVRAVEAVVEALDDAWLAAVPDHELPRLADALARADAAFAPHSFAPACIAVHVVEELLAADTLEEPASGAHELWRTFRDGFSRRGDARARATRLAEAVAAFEATTPTDAPWQTRRVRLQRLADADRARNRDLIVPFLDAIVEAEEVRRRALAALRVLRLAVGIASAPPAASLAAAFVDPIAEAPLEVAEAGGEVRCWAPSGGAERRLRRRGRRLKSGRRERRRDGVSWRLHGTHGEAAPCCSSCSPVATRASAARANRTR